jgi:hypothetical protein
MDNVRLCSILGFSLVPTRFLAPMVASKIGPHGKVWKAGGWKELLVQSKQKVGL